MLCLEFNKVNKNLDENYEKKLKMKRSNPMHCLFRSNVGYVKMRPFMSYITNTMRTSGHNIFNRKLKINPMSIMTGNVKYIMTQKDHKCRYQKCDFHLSTPFRIRKETSTYLYTPF